MWSAQDEIKISKLSVLKPQQYPAFNPYHRQHSTAVGRASPDLLDSPILIITADVHDITMPSRGWDSPVLAVPLIPTPAQQSRELLMLLRSLRPSLKEMLWRPVENHCLALTMWGVRDPEVRATEDLSLIPLLHREYAFFLSTKHFYF